MHKRRLEHACHAETVRPSLLACLHGCTWHAVTCDPPCSRGGSRTLQLLQQRQHGTDAPDQPLAAHVVSHHPLSGVQDLPMGMEKQEDESFRPPSMDPILAPTNHTWAPHLGCISMLMRTGAHSWKDREQKCVPTMVAHLGCQLEAHVEQGHACRCLPVNMEAKQEIGLSGRTPVHDLEP